jgi:hypothetical protein
VFAIEDNISLQHNNKWYSGLQFSTFYRTITQVIVVKPFMVPAQALSNRPKFNAIAASVFLVQP